MNARPHCNKISGIRDLAGMGVEGSAVLTDTDIVVLEDPRTLDIGTHSVASETGGKTPPVARRSPDGVHYR